LVSPEAPAGKTAWAAFRDRVSLDLLRFCDAYFQPLETGGLLDAVDQVLNEDLLLIALAGKLAVNLELEVAAHECSLRIHQRSARREQIAPTAIPVPLPMRRRVQLKSCPGCVSQIDHITAKPSREGGTMMRKNGSRMVFGRVTVAPIFMG
jgi:hypothetical protein